MRSLSRCGLDVDIANTTPYDVYMETKPVNAKTVKVIEPEELSFEEGVGTTFRPALIECARIGCTHTFFLIRARQRPTLCLTHSEEESRSEDGWTPENSVD